MKDNIAVCSKLQSNYEGYYEGESEWRWLGAVDKAKNIVRQCQGVPHNKILEIGAGEGSILKRLSGLGFGREQYALEISTSAVDVIKKRGIPSLKECSTFDGYNIPYESDSFDLVILSHVLEHVEFPRKILYEAKRVGRYIFVEVPLELTIKLRKDFTFTKVGHINFYSWKTIRILIQTCGLEVISQFVTNPSYKVYKYRNGIKAIMRWLPKELLLRLSIGLASRIWTYHCSLLCRGE